MLQVTPDDLLYKCFVKSGLISSNTEAKRLFESGAVSINQTLNKHSELVKLTLEHDVKFLHRCALQGFWLRIGKKFCEQLSIERNGKIIGEGENIGDQQGIYQRD